MATTETRAVLRGVRLSVDKGRLVADLIRGKKVDQALNILNFTQKKAAGIIRKVLESAIANAPHIRFELQNDEHAGSTVLQTNRTYAVRVLALILDNAQKFTKEGSVCLKVDTTDELVAKFIVEDTGIGIAEEEAERIFDEFVQLDDYYDGTGIGLTIARSIARRMGGEIVLDTYYKQGARFIVTLPK